MEGVDFILSHFSEPLFPRKISTAASQGKQFTVNSKEELLEACARADYLDCRINAYPALTESGERQQAPDFIFIDLDKSTFKSENDHRQVLNDTLHAIKRELGAYPTVVWSGNGYHIYCPIQNHVLENIVEFAKFDRPSIQFLRYAEHRLSGDKCDPAHSPSFKSCQLRIPGGYNSKCVARGVDGEVKIVKRWNGARPWVTKKMIKEFLDHLTAERLWEMQRRQRYSKSGGNSDAPSTLQWIETLLQTPIEDYRKNTVSLILAPYLINIRKLSYDEAFTTIERWLEKCNGVQRLGGSFRHRIKMSLDDAVKHHVKPMKLSTLQSRNPDLYSVVVKQMGDSSNAGSIC